MPTVDPRGLRIHYERAGAGPPLVLLHGMGSSSQSWQPQLEGLAGSFEVIAWDMRGYGQSDDPAAPYAMRDAAGDLAGLLDSLGHEQVHVCGLSMGGVVALEVCRWHPERVRSLVLADTNAGQGSLTPEERQRRLRARLDGAGDPARLARERTPALFSPDVPPDVLARATAIMAGIHPAGYRYAAQAFSETDERDLLPRIAAPTLVLWGERDSVCSRDEAEYLAGHIPGARLDVIPGAGHLSNQENPAAFNDALRRFLGDQPQGPKKGSPR